MKYVRTTFETFLKFKLNEKLLKKDNEDTSEIVDKGKEKKVEGEENVEKPEVVIQNKKKGDTIDEIISEYKKLQIEYDSLFKS